MKIEFDYKDMALPKTLRFYQSECRRLGNDEIYIERLEHLINQVKDYQEKNGSDIPSIVSGME